MPKKLFVLASLILVLQAPAVFSRPPDGPSGRLVQDAVPALQAEVKRLEKEVARSEGLAEHLTVARARLAAAEGRTGEARAAWEKIIATRLARLDVLLSGRLDCDPSDVALYRGSVAEARWALAEVEGDRAALAQELPKVIAFREDSLTRLRRLAKAGAISPDEAEKEEKALHKELREARQRLDAVKRK